MSNAKLIIELVDPKRITTTLSKIIQNDSKTESIFVAFHKDRAGSIVYDTSGKQIKVDYLDGAGFTFTRYKDFYDLKSDLQIAGYLIVNAKLLELELKLLNLSDSTFANPIKEISDQIKGHIDTCALRMGQSNNTEYWKAQREAYEAVLHIIRGVTAVA
jgi:hypothetical protein